MNRENIFSSSAALGPSFSCEAVLDETGDRVVKAVREDERSAAVALRAAVAVADAFEKLFAESARGVSVKTDAANCPP